MEFLNQEESSSNIRIVNTTEHDVSIDQQYDVDPLSPHVPTTTQLPNSNVTDSSMARMTNNNFTNEEEEGSEGNNDDDDEFTASHNRSRFRSFVQYTHAILALLSAVVLDLTSANNKSVLSKIVRIVATAFTYVTIFTSATGLLLWAIAYLMDHGWYLLAVTSAVMLLLQCALLLAFYEWMWQWQGRVISYLCGSSDNNSNSNSYIGYNRLRSVHILDDDDMEDHLTLRGWIKQIVRALVTCLIWSLYCAWNVKVDFWITDQYMEARPAYYAIELRLVNCFEAATILLGAALLLYYAYPSFYRLNFCRDRLPSSATTSITGTTVDTTIADVPFAFASTEDVDNESYTIAVDEDNEVTMGVGMQNLII
jgi:hypothetical protein